MRTYDLTPDAEKGRPAVGAYTWMVHDLLDQPTVHTGEWQAMDTTKSKAHVTHELEDVTVMFDPLPFNMDCVVPAIDQSWADDHFLERVSGIPYNPAPSHVDWPYAVRGNADHTSGRHATFDHTYPERFWPRRANVSCPSPEQCMGRHDHDGHYDRRGIRFNYGDLNSVVDLLVQRPLTRQAYLPVWFPEDTGAGINDNQMIRVPCTLGYHFMVRDNALSCRYFLRSCDIYRHFSNDVYFAGMLTKWVMKEFNRRTVETQAVIDAYSSWRPLTLGKLVMHITSLHAFAGDRTSLKDRLDGLK